MEAILFKLLAQRIAATMPEVKQIELYTGQYLNPQADANPVFPPAMFVEFGEIMWTDLGELTQQAVVLIRMHVVTQHVSPFGMERKPDAIAAYAEAVTRVSQRLHQALHGHTPASEGAYTFNTITRSRTTRAIAPPTLHVAVSEFELLAGDASAQLEYTIHQTPPPDLRPYMPKIITMLAWSRNVCTSAIPSVMLHWSRPVCLHDMPDLNLKWNNPLCTQASVSVSLAWHDTICLVV